MTGPISIQPSGGMPSGTDRAAALQDAARQLEGVFLSMMFEEMAKGTGTEASLFPKTAGQQMYEQWFRGEVATQYARGGGLGLGDTMAAQIGGAPRSGLSTVEMVSARTAHPSRLTGDSRRPSPVEGPVTSGFGPRVHPVTGAPDQHEGVDIAAPTGTPVRAPYGGRVLKVQEDPYLGLHVVLEHRGGYRSLYAHLSRTRLRPGQMVDAQSTLGEVGATGRVTGPHLHFALYRHGRPVDPERWIRLRSAS